ncbi:MAG: maleylacetate reductase [Pseudomonadota bacterium]
MSVHFSAGFRADAPVAGIRFGAGARTETGFEVKSLGCARAVVLATPDQRAQAEELAESMGKLAVGVIATAAMHTPVDVSEAAVEECRTLGVDCLVAMGGGSSIGLGKAIALRTDLPVIAVPTTYAGSEATPVIGQSEGGRKTALTDVRVQPQRIVYDPELVATLPVGLSVTSGLNAVAHAAEALYARDRNPLATSLAIAGIRLFAVGLPKVIDNPADLEARGDTLMGAWHCGAVLGQVGMALHHKLCHVLGGTFGLPHAAVHAIVLPHAIAYNEVAVPNLLAPLAEVLGAEKAGQGLFDLSARLGAPQALTEIGFGEDEIEQAVTQALQNSYWNPRELTASGLTALLRDAVTGRRPQS